MKKSDGVERTGGAFEADPKTGALKRVEPEMQDLDQVKDADASAAEPEPVDPAPAVPEAAAAAQPPKKED